MGAATATAIAPLEIRRVIEADVSELWAAWTQPELLAAWFAPGPMQAEVLALDVRVGGRYRIRMSGGESGEAHIVGGEFIEVVPEQRLVMSWGWEDGETQNTRVSVRFHRRAEGAEIVIVHEGLPSEAAREAHGKGWAGCLDKLEQRG